jgi:hypothetical protein
MKKKTIDMYLSVKRDLEVKVELSENYPYSFVMANKETTLTCEVEGFPIDQNNLEWSFRYVLKYVIANMGAHGIQYAWHLALTEWELVGGVNLYLRTAHICKFFRIGEGVEYYKWNVQKDIV